jgi:hypothetical protein
MRNGADEKPRLVIGPEATWFRVDDAPIVILEKRKPLRKLLLSLAYQPRGAMLPVTGAFEAGWPGDRALPKAAATRVYTAVHVLKKLGLDGILVRHESGYFLDAWVQVTHDSQSTLPSDESMHDLEQVG